MFMTVPLVLLLLWSYRLYFEDICFRLFVNDFALFCFCFATFDFFFANVPQNTNSDLSADCPTSPQSTPDK